MTSRMQLTAIIAATLLPALTRPIARAQHSQPNPLKEAKDGLTVNESRAYQGFSLVAPMNSTSTYLIDMEGRIVNEWKSAYTPALSAYLLENGHLLRPGSERGFGF